MQQASVLGYAARRAIRVGASGAIKPSSEIEIVFEIALRRQPLHVVCKQWDIKFRRRSVTAVCVWQILAWLFQLAKDSIFVSKYANVSDAWRIQGVARRSFLACQDGFNARKGRKSSHRFVPVAGTLQAYGNLEGNRLEALARLFAQNVRIYAYPMTVADLRESLDTASTSGWEWSEKHGWVSAAQLRRAGPLGHLFAYLLASNFIVPMQVPAALAADA
jgi:hypothetical protein